MALITATTAASVTGTVAWFTATRSVTVTATQFETKTEGSNLAVSVKGDADSGTSVDFDKTNAIKINGALTHGSYNAKKNNTGNLYSPNVDDEGTVTSYNELGTVSSHTTSTGTGTDSTTNKWKASTASSSTTTLWYGVAWTMTFTQQADPNGFTNHLLFNASNSLATELATTTGITEDNSTIKGFRLALMTSSNCIVVSKDDVQTHVTNTTRFTYTAVSSDASFSSSETYYKKVNDSNYVVDNVTSDTWSTELSNGLYTRSISGESSTWEDGIVYTTFGATYTKANDYATNLTSDAGYLGTIEANNGLTVTAVAWFEGTDTDAITTKLSDGTTDRIMSKVSASLDFYSRKA